MYSSSVSANREALWVGTRHQGHGHARSRQQGRRDKEGDRDWRKKQKKRVMPKIAVERKATQTSLCELLSSCLPEFFTYYVTAAVDGQSVARVVQTTSHSEAQTQVRSGTERRKTTPTNMGGGVHFYGFISTKKGTGEKKKQACLQTECVEFHIEAHLGLQPHIVF